FAPNLKFVNTSDQPDTTLGATFNFEIKPNICVYPDPPDLKSHLLRCDSSSMEMHIEFKWTQQDNLFFLGQSKVFMTKTHKAVDTLRQITTYITVQLRSQYQTHAFLVLIVREIAYIIQWDQDGTIVMKAIKYNTQPYLADFFRCY
ncbi:hypothetical protein SCLCIDRAFT_56852, partial [Scleroderma citrinum Foug A]